MEQTVDIPANVPAGRTILTFTPVSEGKDQELINRHAARLNDEAMDVLSYQQIEL